MASDPHGIVHALAQAAQRIARKAGPEGVSAAHKEMPAGTIASLKIRGTKPSPHGSAFGISSAEHLLGAVLREGL